MSVERNYFDNIQKLEQEIKQLKENERILMKRTGILGIENNILKQKLEKIKGLQREYSIELYDNVLWKEMRKELEKILD